MHWLTIVEARNTNDPERLPLHHPPLAMPTRSYSCPPELRLPRMLGDRGRMNLTY